MRMHEGRKNTPAKGVWERLNWEWDSARKRRSFWFRFYTLLFLLVFLLAFSPLLLTGKPLMWKIDGRDQMLPWLAYTGIWVRRIFENLFSGSFSVPLYDLSLGWGDDVIGYLAASGQIEPINLLFSALVPTRYVEYLYGPLVALRLYLAGLSFLCLCRYFQKKPYFALAGCLIYLFNAYTIYCAPSFPYFINAMIVLPLLIAETDRLVRGGRVHGFILCAFGSALCGFYLLYMLTIITGVYALVCFFDAYPRGERLRAFPGLTGKGMGCYLLGLGLSAPLFLPALAEYFSASRSASHSLIISADLRLHMKTFFGRLLALIAPKRYYAYDFGLDYPAYAAVFLPACVVLFAGKGRKKLKWLTGIGLFAFFFFLGGWIMNGFQYVCNRWSFAISLIAGFVVAEILPEVLCLGSKKTLLCFIVLSVYALIPLFIPNMRDYTFFEVGTAFLAATVLLAFTFSSRSNLTAKQLRAAKGVSLCLVAANLIVNSLFMFSTERMGWERQFESIALSSSPLFGSIEDEAGAYLNRDFAGGRVDSSALHLDDAMVFGVPGTLFYNSLENKYVLDFMEKMEGSENNQNFKTLSSEQRTIKNAMLSVRYQFEESKNKKYLPYGYEQIGETSDGALIFENKYALPWGYTYDSAVSYEHLEGLNGVEMQEALLQAVALEDAAIAPAEAEPEYHVEKLPYTISFVNCEWEDGVWKSSGDGMKIISLHADMPAGKEYYLRLKGLDIGDFGEDILTVGLEDSFQIMAASGGILRKSLAEGLKYPWYFGREDYLFCLGFAETDRETVSVAVQEEGEFKLEDIELIALPLDDYPARVEALRAEPLENIVMEDNRISGTVDLSKDKILCLTIPFSKGWTAYVDGEKAEILKANYAFMGLQLAKGHHDVEFTYCSPGLKLGCALFAVSLAAVILLAIFRKREKTGGTAHGRV